MVYYDIPQASLSFLLALLDSQAFSLSERLVPQ